MRYLQPARHQPVEREAVRGDGGARRHAPVASLTDRLLDLQRTAGNYAVQVLLRSTGIPGLRVSRPDDARERAADRIAESVMRSPEPAAGRASRRTAVPERDGASSLAPGLLSGSGRPLPASVRRYFEPRFGSDLGAVRVHTGAEADRSADSMNAAAFTIGRDVVVHSDSYAPGTDDGRRLLAHELAHVVDRQPGPPTVFRTPAAPEYHGVTGRHDPARVRIDPIATFVPSVHLPPATVNVVITDPDVKHITWELYDPKDQMVDGWTTLPGNESSTTRPFTLRASRFAEGQVAGTYLLRCTGLNARHEPIVYADHKLAVLQPVGTEISADDYDTVDIDALSQGRPTFDGGFGSRAFRRFVYEGREISKSEAAQRMVGNLVREDHSRSFYDPDKRWAVTASMLGFDTGVTIRDELWMVLSSEPRDRDMQLAILRGSETAGGGRFGGYGGPFGYRTGGRGSAGRGSPGRGGVTPKPRPGVGAGLGEGPVQETFRSLGGVRQGYKVRVCNDATVVETPTSVSNVGLNARYQGGAFTDPSTKTVWLHESMVGQNGVTRSWGSKLNMRQVMAHELGHAETGSFDCAVASRTGANAPGLTAAERQGLLNDALKIDKVK